MSDCTTDRVEFLELYVLLSLTDVRSMVQMGISTHNKQLLFIKHLSEREREREPSRLYDNLSESQRIENIRTY